MLLLLLLLLLTLVGLVDEDLHGGQVSLCCGGGGLEAVQRHKHLQEEGGDAASIGHQPGACSQRQQACAAQPAARARLGGGRPGPRCCRLLGLLTHAPPLLQFLLRW